MLAGRQSPQDLGKTLRNLRESAAQEAAATESYFPTVLNLGQWWLPNGNQVMITVIPIIDISHIDSVPRLQLSINIREFFHVGVSRLIPTCYDQQAIFPQKVAYSQQQAARIFGGLYDDFYPPQVDGKVVTDLAELELLDWSILTAEYWEEPDMRREFCKLLQELETRSGYSGPFAPLRSE